MLDLVQQMSELYFTSGGCRYACAGLCVCRTQCEWGFVHSTVALDDVVIPRFS